MNHNLSIEKFLDNQGTLSLEQLHIAAQNHGVKQWRDALGKEIWKYIKPRAVRKNGDYIFDAADLTDCEGKKKLRVLFTTKTEKVGKRGCITVVYPDEKNGILFQASGVTPGGFSQYVGRIFSAKRDESTVRLAAALLGCVCVHLGAESLILPGNRDVTIDVQNVLDFRKLTDCIVRSVMVSKDAAVPVRPFSLNDEINDNMSIRELKANGWIIQTALNNEEGLRQGDSSHIINQIQAKTRRLPLMEPLMNTQKVDRQQISNIVEMLKYICTIEIDHSGAINVRIEPPVAYARKRIFGAYAELFAGSRTARGYTEIDAICILGAAARQIRQNGCGGIPRGRFFEVGRLCADSLNIAPEIAQEIIRDVLDASMDDNPLDFIEKEGRRYRFRFAQLGLVFEAMADALTGAWDEVGALNRLLDFSQVSKAKEKHDHTSWKFDELVVYGCACLDMLDNSVRYKLLGQLCSTAWDANVSRRERQEKAICLLSYYLCEGNPVPGALREQMFRAAYANNLYYLQGNMWEYLNGKSGYYRWYAKETLQKACEIDGQYTKEAPYFAFLGWNLGLKSTGGELFLRKACDCQHRTWFGGDMSGYKPDKVIEALGTALEEMKKADRNPADNDIMYFVYGANMLLYSLTNLSLRRNTDRKIADAYKAAKQALENGTTAASVLEAVLWCDYCTRKYNRVYNEEDNSLWTDQRLFLLSAAVRFLSAYEPGGVRVSMTSEMAEAYRKWYGREQGRFKMLMTRLLWYTRDFHNGKFADIFFCIENRDYRHNEFLEYDRLPETLEEFRKNPARLA